MDRLEKEMSAHKLKYKLAKREYKEIKDVLKSAREINAREWMRPFKDEEEGEDGLRRCKQCDDMKVREADSQDLWPLWLHKSSTTHQRRELEFWMKPFQQHWDNSVNCLLCDKEVREEDSTDMWPLWKHKNSRHRLYVDD